MPTYTKAPIEVHGLAREILDQFERLGLNEDEGMRLLYSASPTVISDEAARYFDIADADLPRAVGWLSQQTPKRK